MKILIYSLLLSLLTSCVATTAKLAPVAGDHIAEAPNMQVGDRWKFNDPPRAEMIEKEIVDVKDDGGFTARVITNRTRFAYAHYDKNHQLLSIEGSKPEGSVWNNSALINYPLFIGKTYQISREQRSLMRNKILRFTFNCEVTELTEQEVLTKTVHVFTIRFTVSHTEGWTGTGKIYYSPELKSIVRVIPGQGADAEILAYKVAADQLQLLGQDGTRQGSQGGAAHLMFGYEETDVDTAAITRERQKLADERARLLQDKLAAETARQQKLAEAEQLAAARLAEAKAEGVRLAAEVLAAARVRSEEMEQQAAAIRAEQEAATKNEQKKKERAALDLRAENSRYGIAVIIGNRNYSQHNADVPDVSFAHNDADAIYHYVRETLGYQEGNIIHIKDATQGDLATIFGNERSHKGKLFNWTKPEKSKVFVYYSGHGAPGLADGNGYLLPVNADPMTVELNGYPLETLYANLAKIPAQQITVVLDACFSGSSASGNLVKSASSIALRRVESNKVLRNGAVLTAAAVSEVASWDNDRKMGLFTANFLDGINGGADTDEFGNGDGQVVLSELKNYLEAKVSYAARRNFYRDQHPRIVGDDQLVLSTLGAVN